jgi:hypothetical protein
MYELLLLNNSHNHKYKKKYDSDYHKNKYDGGYISSNRQWNLSRSISLSQLGRR